MDFGVFGDESRRNTNSNMDQAEADSGGASGNDNSNNNNNNGGNGNQGEKREVLTHNVEHPGIICDVCDMTPVAGFRYKCMQCSDFDLCQNCERKGHHAGHVMMRISFPEQATEAIQKYLAPQTPERERKVRFSESNGTGPNKCRRSARRDEDAATANGSTDESGLSWTRGCPYNMGKKEIKKWARAMKRAAYHHQRRPVSEGERRQQPGQTTEQTTEQTTQCGQTPYDFSSAATQIQHFLNSWGLPIDVVELYDQFGNIGRPEPEQNTASSTSPATATTGNENQSASTTTMQEAAKTAAAVVNITEAVRKAEIAKAVQDANLTFQNLRIEGGSIVNGREILVPNAPPASGEMTPVSMNNVVLINMDDSGDNPETEWTLIDGNKIEEEVEAPITITRETFGGRDQAEDEEEMQIINFVNSTQQRDIPISVESSNINLVAGTSGNNNSIPVSAMISGISDEAKIINSQVKVNTTTIPLQATTAAAVASFASSTSGSGSSSSSSSINRETQTPKTATATEKQQQTATSQTSQIPIYPTLPPAFQNAVSAANNAASTLGSILRNIPIVPTPFPPQQQQQQAPVRQPPPTIPIVPQHPQMPVLDDRMKMCLNQLLSMGFSNNDGWLARLVFSNRGDLDSVLNSLFPTGQ